MYFSKDTFGLFGVYKQVECVHFEPTLGNLSPQAERASKMGQFGTTWLKIRSKPWFSENAPRLVVVLEQMNIAQFEPL